jgi:hypothetical protein
MSAVPAGIAPGAPNDYVQRIARNGAALDRYRGEHAQRHARRPSTRTSERVIARLEIGTRLCQARGGASRSS